MKTKTFTMLKVHAHFAWIKPLLKHVTFSANYFFFIQRSERHCHLWPFTSFFHVSCNDAAVGAEAYSAVSLTVKCINARTSPGQWVMWSSKYCSLGLHLDSPAPEIKLFFPTVTVQPSVSMYVCIYLCRETWLKYHFLIGLQPNRGGYSELFQLFLKLEPEKHERISPPPVLWW